MNYKQIIRNINLYLLTDDISFCDKTVVKLLDNLKNIFNNSTIYKETFDDDSYLYHYISYDENVIATILPHPDGQIGLNSNMFSCIGVGEGIYNIVVHYMMYILKDNIICNDYHIYGYSSSWKALDSSNKIEVYKKNQIMIYEIYI